MLLLTALSRSLVLVAMPIAGLGFAGCVMPARLSLVEAPASDTSRKRGAVESETANVLRAFADAKESVVEVPEQSVLKTQVAAKPAVFARAQIEAAAPPAGLDSQPPPELLPTSPPRVELSSQEGGAQADAASQLSTQQRIKSIREISLDIRPPLLFNDQQQAMPGPTDEAAVALPLFAQAQPFTRDDLAQSGYDWQPAAEGLTFCYQPLYFQEVNVERYGRSFGMFQPVVSMASFYGRVPLLPYMAFARPARRCTCPPHWTLPGYRIPEWERHEFVPSLSGGAAEVAALAGIILLIP